MKKRVAQKVISRLVLELAPYPPATVRRALRRRPNFWTVQLPSGEGLAARAGRRARRSKRLQFGPKGGSSGHTLTFDLPEAVAAPVDSGAPTPEVDAADSSGVHHGP